MTMRQGRGALRPRSAEDSTRRGDVWRRMRRIFVHDVAVDLGTVTTLISCADRGLVLVEPSAVALARYTGELVAVGRDALAMLGREPRDVVVRYPMRDGMVADADLAEKMLKAFLARACAHAVGCRTHMLLGLPSSATDVERKAVEEIARRAGADRVHLVEEGVAAAVGLGLPLEDGCARMIVDIGGGVTGISIVSAHGVIASYALRVAGNEMTEAILDSLERNLRVLVGWQIAEGVKRDLSCALPFVIDKSTCVLGKSVTGEVQEVEVAAYEVARAIERPIRMIVNAVREVIESAPPDVAADIHRFGLTLTGGGSLVRSLDERLREELGVPVIRAERPLEAVIAGLTVLLERPELRERFRLSAPRPSWEGAVLREDGRSTAAWPFLLSRREEERVWRRRSGSR